MRKSSAITATLAASLVLSAPAFAAAKIGRPATRSAQSLPLRLATPRIVSPIKSPLIQVRQPSSLAASLGTTGISATTLSPAAVQNPRVRPIGGRFGNGRLGGGLATLFSFLPPQLQQVIATALGNSPNGGQLCEVLGLPNCQLPDSTG